MAVHRPAPTHAGQGGSKRGPTPPTTVVLILGAGVSLALLVGMMIIDRSLKTPEAPCGIISLELAGSPAGAERILASWDISARIQAGISLGLDFFFLAAYAFTLAGASRKVGMHLRWHFRRLGALGGIMAGAAWLAGVLDFVENLVLIQLLIGPGKAWQPALAAWCAWPKFGLGACALFYIGTGAAILCVQRAGIGKPS